MSAAITRRDDIEPIAPCAQYSETEIETAFAAMATEGGSRRAAERLEATGMKVAPSTLRLWRQTYPRRYLAVAERLAPEIERAVTTRALGIALSTAEGIDEAVALERERIAAREVKDASASSRNLATTMGISVDKMLVLQGRPQQITEHRRDAAETFEEIADRFPGLFVEGQAEEIHADQDSQQEAGEEIPG